jgi:two-component system CheB/CheR fusion protein
MELRKKVIDIAQVIERAVDACRSSIDGRENQSTVTIPMRPLLIRGDATRMEQVITNLLSNATKYTETGGQIRLNAEEVGTQVVIKSGNKIRDSGIGIDPEALLYIFDLLVQPVRRVDRSEGDWDWA